MAEQKVHTDRQLIEKRYEAMIAEAQESWCPHWRDIMEHVAPRRGHWLGDQPNKGYKKNQKIVASTAGQSLRVLVSGMMAGLTSPNWPWFRLTSGQPDLDRFGPAAVWLKEVQDRMYQVFAKSNLYRVLPTMYAEMGAVGTSAALVDSHPKRVIHLTQYTIGSYALATDDDGMVATLARRIDKTVEQLVMQFGFEQCSERVQNHWNQGNLGEYIEVRHIIERNDDRLEGSFDHRQHAFRSFWWEKDHSKHETPSGSWLRKSGYSQFPVLAPRWEVSGESAYGTDCPGMMAIPDVRQHMLMVRRKSEAVEKQLRPPLAAPSAMRATGVSLAPAALNYVDQHQVQGSIEPILNIRPAIGEIREDIAEIKNEINTAFFSNLFITLLASQNQPPQKTATEIASIEGEKLLMLGPVLERVFNDLLTPLIERTFEIMLRQGLIPEAPPDLQGTALNVDFVSTLAQAQKAVNTVTLERGVSFVGNISAVFPDAADKLDSDELVEQYWEMLGAPPEIMRDQADVDAMRQGRQQQQQMAQGAEVGKTGAEAAKLLSETDVGSESALDRFLGTGAAA
jgi:hypothetical protein